nr:DUF1993 family protein [Mesorhizobium sanjuanii]
MPADGAVERADDRFGGGPVVDIGRFGGEHWLARYGKGEESGCCNKGASHRESPPDEKFYHNDCGGAVTLEESPEKALRPRRRRSGWTGETHVTISMYEASVPVFTARLKALSDILSAAEQNAHDRKIDPQVFLTSRLAPDMFALTRQVQIATDHAKGAPSRLAGREVPKYEDNEASFADLQARIAKTLDLLATFSAADFEGSDDKTIELKLGQREISMAGLQYLLHLAMPNFYFHVTTAYDILRHNGVPLSKAIFLGSR